MASLVDAVRRTTITTYDIEMSLRYYRDTLDMRVWYDGVFDDPVVREVYDLPDGTRTRVCILEGGHEGGSSSTQGIVSGMIGLMHFEGLPSPTMPAPDQRPSPGEIVIMFGTQNMRALEARLIKGGFNLYGPPIKLDTPGRQIVYELLGRDPNGVRIAFAQQSEIDP